ncbi:hypothetical protein BCR44DRAFT_1511587 [Catenaria anguillulae PL171]|uniref:Uncharacterized protein n=1 Tax=Catenaria anguillulae PL171 TaxID=765915 RepID=A0A1Y2HTD9_9FUNG|nr:hypothetical protein BCR44DRAFT_1511587 [Catenaria anguillulae PL171]
MPAESQRQRRPHHRIRVSGWTTRRYKTLRVQKGRSPTTTEHVFPDQTSLVNPLRYQHTTDPPHALLNRHRRSRLLGAYCHHLLPCSNRRRPSFGRELVILCCVTDSVRVEHLHDPIRNRASCNGYFDHRNVRANDFFVNQGLGNFDVVCSARRENIATSRKRCWCCECRHACWRSRCCCCHGCRPSLQNLNHQSTQHALPDPTHSPHRPGSCPCPLCSHRAGPAIQQRCDDIGHRDRHQHGRNGHRNTSIDHDECICLGNHVCHDCSPDCFVDNDECRQDFDECVGRACIDRSRKEECRRVQQGRARVVVVAAAMGAGAMLV